MKNKKTFLLIALIAAAIIPVYAQQYDSENDFQIDFDKSGVGVVITKYVGAKKEVRIPPRIQNSPVTGIVGAFAGNKNITRVTIPHIVISIVGAFNGCTSLTSVSIPDSVKKIDLAFQNCTSLTSVKMPAGAAEIGIYAFDGCASLTAINIPPSVAVIGDCAFQGCASLTAVTIPAGVTTIGDQAFRNCASLTSVRFDGAIPEAGVNKNIFPGDLREKYLAGGIGTYTRPTAESGAWTKQQ